MEHIWWILYWNRFKTIIFCHKYGQDCCENWGYLSSEDDFGSFIGSELKNVYVTDSELGTIVSNMKEDLDAGSAMFINVETTNGLLQFVAYNEHNGYYGHEVKLVSKYNDKIVIEADDVLWQWNIYYNLRSYDRLWN